MGDWVKLTDPGEKAALVYINLAMALSIRRERDITMIALPATGADRVHFLQVKETPEQIMTAPTVRRDLIVGSVEP